MTIPNVAELLTRLILRRGERSTRRESALEERTEIAQRTRYLAEHVATIQRLAADAGTRRHIEM